MAEPELLYKITVLNLLQMSPVPLSNSKITEFFQEKDYTGYFTVQIVLNNLVDNKMIQAESDNNTTMYSITPEGYNTLTLFSDRITPGIEADIKDFFSNKKMEIEEDISVSANYDRSTYGGYVVHMRYSKNSRLIMDFSLNIPSQEYAESICINFKNRPEEVYNQLLDVLL